MNSIFKRPANIFLCIAIVLAIFIHLLSKNIVNYYIQQVIYQPTEGMSFDVYNEKVNIKLSNNVLIVALRKHDDLYLLGLYNKKWVDKIVPSTMTEYAKEHLLLAFMELSSQSSLKIAQMSQEVIKVEFDKYCPTNNECSPTVFGKYKAYLYNGILYIPELKICVYGDNPILMPQLISENLFEIYRDNP